MRAANEESPLLASLDLYHAVKTLAACVAYIALSSCLINFNKFLMHDDRFPHSIALAFFHMGASTLFSVLFYAVAGSYMYPKADVVLREPRRVMLRIIPLAVAFTASMILSNEAYRHCSVPFLQMCKELNVVMVYLMALACGLEVFNIRQCTVLFVVLLGCTAAIHGEMRFVWTGFAMQIGSQLCEVTKITLQHMIMSSQGYSLDALSMVMFMCPLCFVTSSAALYFMWDPRIIGAVREHWMLLILNCVNAFLLNVAVSYVIKLASGVAFVLAGLTKDIMIVSVSVMLFAVQISMQQTVGFTIALVGVLLHALVKQFPDDVEKHGVVGVLKLLVKS